MLGAGPTFSCAAGVAPRRGCRPMRGYPDGSGSLPYIRAGLRRVAGLCSRGTAGTSEYASWKRTGLPRAAGLSLAVGGRHSDDATAAEFRGRGRQGRERRRQGAGMHRFYGGRGRRREDRATPGEGRVLVLRADVEADRAAEQRELPCEDHLGELAGLLPVAARHLDGDEGDGERQQCRRREGELGAHPFGAVGGGLVGDWVRAGAQIGDGSGSWRPLQPRLARRISHGPRRRRTTMLPPSATFSTLPRVAGSVAPISATRAGSCLATFSTLPRVAGSVAAPLGTIRHRMDHFQYPTTGRWVCRDQGDRTAAQAAEDFQYPTTGRWVCRSASGARPTWRWGTFSTLPRVAGSVADQHRRAQAELPGQLSVPYHGSLGLSPKRFAHLWRVFCPSGHA